MLVLQDYDRKRTINSENIIPEHLYVIYNDDFSKLNKKEFDRFSKRTKIEYINFDLNGYFQFEVPKSKKEENLIISQIKKEIVNRQQKVD